MSKELQNDGFTIEAAVEDTQPAAQPETSENPRGAELATEDAETEVKAEPTEAEKEAKRQAAFNKQYGEKKQAERERDAVKAELEKLQQSQIPEKPQEVGNFPNEFDYDSDEEYAAAKETFVESVRNAEQYNQMQTQSNYIAQQQENERERQRQEKFNSTVQSYTQIARNNGINADELQSAANAVQNYGITVEISKAILEDSEGPLITKYLAANPDDVAQLINMDLVSAGSYLATIKSRAVSLKQKTSSAPKPTTEIQGGGGDPNRDSPLIRGASFE